MRSNRPCVDRLGIMRCKEVVISPCVHLKGVVECRELETESWSVKVQWSVKVNVEALLGHNRGREKQRSQFHFTSQNFVAPSGHLFFTKRFQCYTQHYIHSDKFCISVSCAAFESCRLIPFLTLARLIESVGVGGVGCL